MPVLEIRVGDVVQLRKPHPCGGSTWRVVRTGADIAARCLRCNHRVMIERPVFERRIKAFLERGPAPPSLPLSTD
jgi:hypothetical protein